MRFSLKLRLRWIYWRQNHTIRWQKMSIELLKGRLMNVSGMILYQDLARDSRPASQRMLESGELCFHISYLELQSMVTPPLPPPAQTGQ